MLEVYRARRYAGRYVERDMDRLRVTKMALGSRSVAKRSWRWTESVTRILPSAFSRAIAVAPDGLERKATRIQRDGWRIPRRKA